MGHQGEFVFPQALGDGPLKQGFIRPDEALHGFIRPRPLIDFSKVIQSSLRP